MPRLHLPTAVDAHHPVPRRPVAGVDSGPGSFEPAGASGGPEIIRVEGLCKVFGRQEDLIRRRLRKGESFADAAAAENVAAPLSDVNLSISEGEIYAIMGLSGSGKSTLVRCINGLIRPTQGQAFVAGTSISSASAGALRELRQRRMSMVFQSFALLPHLTVANNVEFGLMLRRDDVQTRRRRVGEVLEMVGLAAWRDRRVDELSGGMKQRIGLARALAPDPDILIMDEPFSALDPLIRRSLQDELLRLQKELKKTILFVTHDFDEATRIGSRIVIMKAGRPVQVGTAAQLFTQPCDDYVRAFTAHVDCMQLMTAGELARAIPVTPDEDQPCDASDAVAFAANASLATVLANLRLGGRVSMELPDGASRRRLVRAERVLAFVNELYTQRQEH